MKEEYKRDLAILGIVMMFTLPMFNCGILPLYLLGLFIISFSYSWCLGIGIFIFDLGTIVKLEIIRWMLFLQSIGNLEDIPFHVSRLPEGDMLFILGVIVMLGALPERLWRERRGKK